MSRLVGTMTVVGVGLIGGSMALACRRAGLCREIVGYDRSRGALETARRRGIIHRMSLSLAEAVAGADLIVLATPVGTYEALAKRMAPHLSPTAVVTDVGSVKGLFVKRLERILGRGGRGGRGSRAGVRFVGGHPIAGRERAGIEAAEPGLFRDARCILTPTPATDPQALRLVSRLWRRIGAQVVLMDPMRHDRVFATVSHLPHLVAYSLVHTAMGQQNGALLAFSAGGFGDFTRVAASSPEMWRDICLGNRQNIVGAVTAYERQLTQIKRMVTKADGRALYRLFREAQTVREHVKKHVAREHVG